MKKTLIAIALTFSPLALAQVSTPSIVPVQTAPSGACSAQLPIKLQTPNGGLYTCQNGTWGSIGTTGGPAFSVQISAPDAVLKLPRTDVRSFGAVGNGTTDNCTSLSNASAYAQSVGAALYFPPSTGYFGTSCTVPFLGNWIVDGSGPMALAGGTAASMALISTGTSQTMDHKGIYGPGIINGNSLSPTIVWVEQGHHINISVAGIIGIAASGKGVYFGDDAGVGAGGNEGDVYDTGFGLSSALTAQSSSTCVYISGGNGSQGSFTDDNVHDNVLHGCTIGYQDHVGGNNYFLNNHAWDFAMTTCFDEYGNGGTMVNEYCDSPTTYGFHIRGTESRILGGTAFNGSNGPDDTATAVEFDVPAEPQALISGLRIYGEASHRWAADTNLGFSTALTTWCNIFDESFVAAIQEGAVTCIQGVKFNITTGSLQMKFGTFSMSPTAITCTSTCTFSNGTSTNIWVATLSANATSTFVTSNPGDRIYTFMICQPGSGGPFTFTPPTNSVGFGAIGTAAGLCSVQNFIWDGTTLRATSTMMTNE